MNYIFRIAVGIFTLSACLKTHPVNVPIWSFKKNVDRLFESSCSSTFYSPKDVEVDCIIDGLKCFKQELDVLRSECNSTDRYIEQVKNSLDKMIKERPPKVHGPTNSNSCACESSPQLPLNEFLDKMKSLAELHGSTRRSISQPTAAP